MEENFEVIGNGLGQIFFIDSKTDDQELDALNIICITSREYKKIKLLRKAAEAQIKGIGFEIDSDTEEFIKIKSIQFQIYIGMQSAKELTEEYIAKLKKKIEKLVFDIIRGIITAVRLKDAQEKIKLLIDYRFRLQAICIIINI